MKPAPSGENFKRKQLEYDGLGRLTSVCEITAAAGSGSCGQTVAQTGYLTRYSYGPNSFTVTQNAQSSSTQTRTYAYDDLGRLTSETNPESGTKTYTYDSDSTCGTSAGDLVKRVDALGNMSCYAYDALHRNTAITYPSGTYASVTPEKHFVYDSATVNGATMQNSKGQLAEAYTGPSAGKITDLGFSYSARGEITDTWEATPNSSGSYYHVAASYWSNGLVETLNPNLTDLPSWMYSPDGEGRMNTVSTSNGQNLVTGTVYNSSGAPTTVALGSSLSDTFAYDANTGRMTEYAFNVEGNSVTGTLTWNANGTLGKLAIYDPFDNLGFNKTDTQTCSNNYDDLGRLIANNCGSVWAQTFSYDAFGNISASGSSSFQPTYTPATNQFHTLPAGVPSYDANGNVTNDGFHSYSWDAEGNALSIDGGTPNTYDALGRRIALSCVDEVYGPTGDKIENGSTCKYGSSDAYIKLPGGAVAWYNGGPQLAWYMNSDWLGTTRLLSAPGDFVGESMAVSPFGLRYEGQPYPVFTGAATHDLTPDLWTFPARNYQPTEGRWVSPDPAGLGAVDLTDPQTLNRYAYVRNNPLSLVDPTGLQDEAGICDNGAPSCQGIKDPPPSGITFRGNSVPGCQYWYQCWSWVPVDPSEFVGLLLNGLNALNTPTVTQPMASGSGGGSNPSNNVQHVSGGCSSLPGFAAINNAAQAAISAFPVNKNPTAWLRGIKIHAAFSYLVSDFPNTTVNVPYKNGAVAGWFTSGSVRPDAVYGNVNSPNFVIELKTGGARLQNPQLSNYLQNLPPNTPLCEVSEVTTK